MQNKYLHLELNLYMLLNIIPAIISVKSSKDKNFR